jgi:hypothetical protein
MNTVLRMTRARRDLRARCDFRQGYLFAISLRMFPRLPAMFTESELRKWRESDDFKQGESVGNDCALATSDIDFEPAANEESDPMLRAACICAAAVSLIVVALSVSNGGVV